MLTTSLFAAEPPGQWQAPNPDGRPWKHAGSSLSFPQNLGGYRLAGIFSYQNGGHFVRYENREARARADIFLFATEPLPRLEDQHRRILKEIDAVVGDMQAMVSQGRYKNLQLGDLDGREIVLWQRASVPIASRTVTATRLGFSEQGAVEAVVKQWIGVTVLNNHLITIRHMRPANTGDEGDEEMKGFVGLIFQIIKDPSLREHIQALVDNYLANPFSEDGEQAAAAVLAYLQQTPYFPINIPEYPIAGWLDHCRAVAPGTEEHLLRAFMLGSAKAAFADGDAEVCQKEGARQFAKIYRQLVKEHAQIAKPEMDRFVDAAEKGLGVPWLKEASGAVK